MTEMIAPVVALAALGSRAAGQQILVMVDSEAVEGALVKGASGSHDLDVLAGIFWAICVHLRVAPYVDRVPTDGNPADDPSRGRFGVLERNRATRLEPELQSFILEAWTAAFPNTKATS